MALSNNASLPGKCTATHRNALSVRALSLSVRVRTSNYNEFPVTAARH